jgi:arylsulfatase A-like enzyme
LQSIYEGHSGSASVKVGEYTFEMRPKIDEIITDKAVSYVKGHAKDVKPFFLYVPFSNPHSPPIPNPRFDDKRHTNYQNVLREIDFNSGRIFDALKEAGIDDNTIVVWTSDNGPVTLQGPHICTAPRAIRGRSGRSSRVHGRARYACLASFVGPVISRPGAPATRL